MQEILEALALIHKENNDKEILSKIINETFCELMDGEITKDAVTKILSILLEPAQTFLVSSEKEQKEIFDNTLQLYKDDIDINDRMLKNHLDQLAEYDECLVTDDKPYFYLLSETLDSIILHKKAINHYLEAKNSYSMIQKGVAASSSSTITKIVNKRKNSLEEAAELMPHDKTIKYGLNVINEFVEHPRAVNIALNQTIALFSPEDIPGLTLDQYEAVKSMGIYLNGDGQIKDACVFYESLAASITAIYRKDTLFSKNMQSDEISFDKLSKIITVIIRHLFKDDYSIESTKISQPIQLRCMYVWQ